jgi:alkaline phosphatase
MKYVDGFVMVVPDENLPAYRKMAKMGGTVWKKYGALEYFECVGDDLTPEFAQLTFPKMAKAKEGETIVFSFIVYKSKADRDKINAKVMQDPAMNGPAMKDMPMPFDMKRMAYGGFKVIVEG